MKLPFQSIRWRTQAWHGLILGIAIAAFCVAAYQLASFNQLRRVDEQLQELQRRLIRSMSHRRMPANRMPPPSGGSESKGKPRREGERHLLEELLRQLQAGSVELPKEIDERFRDAEAGHAFFSIADAHGKVLLRSDNGPAKLDFLPVPSKGMRDEIRDNGEYREIARSAAFGLRTVVGRELTHERREMRRYAGWLGASGFALWLLGLFGGWWIAGKAMQPVQIISDTATRIANGNLRERINTAGGGSELDQLSRVLNDTFDGLNAAFERQRQFTADASHELRTPLTIILSETQRMRKAGRGRRESEYLESFELCHDAASRMRSLVEGLLLLARQDDSASRQSKKECDLAQLAMESVQQLEPLADADAIQIDCELEYSPLLGEPDILMVVLNNLIGNAIAHHGGPGRVRVQCRPTGEGIELRVEDDGPGISEEDLPRIFDRFYRVDRARSSQRGHSGLGLALVKTIVENHDGTIRVRSRVGHGTEFTAHFPRSA